MTKKTILGELKMSLFTIEVDHYATDDEYRYEVLIRKSDTREIVWSHDQSLNPGDAYKIGEKKVNELYKQA